ncbi:hypothetical protein [Devosia sp.]|uniref:hypothetical protein n=1 Tax=Devosia sp. TaxID=1871048 RepID=UPI0037534E33
MPVQAVAFVVGPEDGPGAALRDVATGLGFGAVHGFMDAAQAGRQAASAPLSFFLFAAVDDPAMLQPIADAIRAAPDQRLRFAPLLYFAESPSLDAIARCAAMGFDDVVTLPFTRERVAARIARQLDVPQIYFETADYFGPDRRRRPGEAVRSGRGAGGRHRRIEIVRSPATGIRILRDEVTAA